MTIICIAMMRDYLRLYRSRDRVGRRVASISFGVWVFWDGEWGREGREGRERWLEICKFGTGVSHAF